jgi:hypothetical protein
LVTAALVKAAENNVIVLEGVIFSSSGGGTLDTTVRLGSHPWRTSLGVDWGLHLGRFGLADHICMGLLGLRAAGFPS